ncbi:DUF2264 domain-containing protein [Pelobium manganitolerans]|uniref:DUF2264 domain-containing protein n=1 Tax=Pelobium manganitolerans TaxID=1842495 RepID=UPI003FA38127
MIKYSLSCLMVLFLSFNAQAQKNKKEADGPAQRKYLLQAMLKIADPVLEALSKNELKKAMSVEAAPGKEADRRTVTYLEAFGRLLGGMAPWLELGADDTEEGQIRQKYILLARNCIKNATDPASPDFMNFTKGGQPVVDAAFFAHALLRAPQQLWEPLDAATKANVINALKSTRVITPYYSNWLLFSAMVETAIYKFDSGADFMRIDYAVKSHQNWYLGDGAYGDGPDFHWDYYNSFVIQPMLLDITRIALKNPKLYQQFQSRASRYAEIQERLISPEGTYPPIGRSLTYRFGAFQLLAQVALQKNLPQNISPEQVRCALYAVIKKQIEAPHTFDDGGWLTIGMYGHQPGLGEVYISTGSLYLCAQAFLVLGLSADDAFWTKPNAAWTQKKLWQGLAVPIDHALPN